MSQVVPDPFIIDLGVPGDEDRTQADPQLPAHLRRPLVAALVAFACLLALAASAPGRPGLGEPLWTGTVSLNGFTLGPHNLYLARPDARAVVAVELRTGRPRWSRDITELPAPTVDLGNGVAVVMTRPLSTVGFGRPDSSITLVRERTGEQILRTSGSYYLPSADGRLVLVFSSRSAVAEGCAKIDIVCTDVTAWDIATATTAWRLSLPPEAGVLPSITGDRADGLVELEADGTLRLYDVSTAAVTGTLRLAPEVFRSGGQIALVRGTFLTARRGPEGITLTAYRRPWARPSWSVVVGEFSRLDGQGTGYMFLSDCGPDACMTISGVNTRVINLATGSVTPPMPFEVVRRLGQGVLLASVLSPGPTFGGTGQKVDGFVLDAAGRPLVKLALVSLVEWAGSGDRALVTQEGRQRTGFMAIDERGNLRSLGSVPGIGLTCRAWADIVACADSVGTLRVWRLPV